MSKQVARTPKTYTLPLPHSHIDGQRELRSLFAKVTHNVIEAHTVSKLGDTVSDTPTDLSKFFETGNRFFLASASFGSWFTDSAQAATATSLRLHVPSNQIVWGSSQFSPVGKL